MIDLANKLSEKYHLDLGDYKFSPVLKLTAGISLEYCRMIKENKTQQEPFFFCFPEKKAAALWTSISILTNYYLEDYVNVGDEGIALQTGDKVFIYGCVAEIESIRNGTVKLKFKDQGGLQLNDRLKTQLSLADPKRTLNLLKKYKKARIEAKKKRNPISKILSPNDEVLINQKNLKSKVLLVAGRGQVNKFHDFLKTVKIYNEELRNVFLEDVNLIIRPDLKRYVSSPHSNNEKNEIKFIDFLKKAAKNEKFEQTHEILNSLIRDYNANSGITEKFDQQFDDLVNEFKEDIPQLDILKNKYPGLNENLNEDVRAVVINDISQLKEYHNTIQGFIASGIPVLFFTDRKVINADDLNSFQKIFNERPNAFRLNWNKKKIHSLISNSEKYENKDAVVMEEEDGTSYYIDSVSRKKIPFIKDNFIDQALWDQALRYEGQSIRIETYNGNQLDVLAPELLKHIKALDEFEILQKSFYENLYPAIYALKNSKSTRDSVLMLIGKFNIDFMAVKNQLPKDVNQDFMKAIEIALEFDVNCKSIEYTEDTFTVNVPIEFDKKFSIPLDSGGCSIIGNYQKKVDFTGYPFNEYNGKYLISSVCVNFVPDVKIKCWPNEASLTYNYLNRRLQGGYFLDYLPEGLDIENALLIKSDSDIQTEIDSYLLIDKIETDETETEQNLEFVHRLKYKGYLSNSDGRANWKVNSDVLNFEDGNFMFLAKGSKILCLSENSHGRIKVFKKGADQFLRGDIIFRYVKDRAAYLEISRRDPLISESYKELDFWKSVLQELYKNNNNDIRGLECFLKTVKHTHELEGNPVHTNLERWLFDEDIISPDEDNLRLILSAAEVVEIENKLITLKKAYKIATAHRISLSTKIKKEISKKISKVTRFSGDFQININGEYIEVETRTISTVERNGIEVDYHNTRKILC
jgi:hypothetical protein